MIPKERAVAFTKLAKDFHLAGSTFDSAALPPSMVAYFLYGHSIELSLKALRILGGVSDGQLRKAGHDLVKSLGHVVERLPRALTNEERAVLDALNPYYREKHFEYVEVGYASLPLLVDVNALSEWMTSEFPKLVRRELLRRV